MFTYLCLLLLFLLLLFYYTVIVTVSVMLFCFDITNKKKKSYRQLTSSCNVFFSYMSATVNVNMLSLYLYSDYFLLAKVKCNYFQKQTKLSCIHCPWFAVAHHANAVLPFVDPFVCPIPYP